MGHDCVRKGLVGSGLGGQVWWGQDWVRTGLVGSGLDGL